MSLWVALNINRRILNSIQNSTGSPRSWLEWWVEVGSSSRPLVVLGGICVGRPSRREVTVNVNEESGYVLRFSHVYIRRRRTLYTMRMTRARDL